MDYQLGNLQVLGLIYDVFGILALGIPLATRGMGAILNESATSWDSNKHAEKALVAGKLDAIFGTGLLVLGFVMQITAQFLSPVSQVVGVTFLGVLAVATPLYYGWFRRSRIRRNLATINSLREQREEESNESAAP